VTAAADARSVGMTMRVRCLVLALLAGLLAAPAAEAKPRARLHAFESCSGLLAYAHRHGIGVVNDSSPFRGGPIPVFAPGSEGGGTGKAGGDQAAATSPTNVQEAGVDEPDRVKAVGTTVYALANDHLQVIDASGATPRMLGSVAIPGYASELLVDGTRALVIAERSFSSGPIALDARIAPPGDWLSRTDLLEIDLADPRAPRVVRTLQVEGGYVDARLAGGIARVVVSTSPRGLIQPDVKGRPPVGALRRGWRRSVRRTRTASWLPGMVLRDRKSGRSARRALVSCRSVRRPRVFSGLDTISVLTIDMARGLPAVDVDSVMSDGETVYASPDRLYIASERWLGEDPSRSRAASLSLTAVHAFDTTQPGETRYVGSGEVPGYVLNQWAMSERGGVLRIATTDQPPWEAEGRKSHSAVRTLEERDGRLVQIGAVGGLGEGESIYAVRYIGDTAYVVTFRQTDPLFTVDLSDPRAPRLVGELKVPGYSAYLHPVGDGLLLGVGRTAGADGRTGGLQLSLFDVSDLAHPRRIASRRLEDESSSEVEYDHHAFLWWGPDHLAMFPLEVYRDRDGFGGAAGFRVTAAGIDPLPRIAHPAEGGYPLAFRRAMVVGDRLVLVSDTGVMSTSLAAPATAPLVEFP
jgi:Beta propeller domain